MLSIDRIGITSDFLFKFNSRIESQGAHNRFNEIIHEFCILSVTEFKKRLDNSGLPNPYVILLERGRLREKSP